MNFSFKILKFWRIIFELGDIEKPIENDKTKVKQEVKEIPVKAYYEEESKIINHGMLQF